MFTKKEIIPIFLILLMLAIAVGLFQSPCLPDKMPTHWNAAGEVDGYSGRWFALFFPPALAIVLYVLMLFLPRTDPLRKNYEKFEKPYYLFRLVIVLFLLLLYSYTILAAVGVKFDIRYFIIPAFSLLFLIMGFMVPKLKRNYFIGFRSPWTLHSDQVWQETHKFAGKSLIVTAILSFFSVFFGKHAFWIFLVIILAGTFIPFFYSYFIYRNLGLFGNKSKRA